MPNPYAPRVRRPVDPFPEARLRAVGAGDELVAYWRAVAGSLDDDGRESLYADWRELSDDELARDVLGNVDELPAPEEAGVEWEAVDDRPELDDVPRNARDVVSWIAEARGADQQHRAETALVVEQQRSTQRVTVLDAVREVIGAS